MLSKVIYGTLLALFVVVVLLLGAVLTAIPDAVSDIINYGDFHKFGAIVFQSPILLGILYVLFKALEKMDR